MNANGYEWIPIYVYCYFCHSKISIHWTADLYDLKKMWEWICAKMTTALDVFRGIPTHRGWVKKIRFAPGKGNQKLLVMYTDGAEVWDTKEVRRYTQALFLLLGPFLSSWFIDWFRGTLPKFPACTSPHHTTPHCRPPVNGKLQLSAGS